MPMPWKAMARAAAVWEVYDMKGQCTRAGAARVKRGVANAQQMEIECYKYNSC